MKYNKLCVYFPFVYNHLNEPFVGSIVGSTCLEGEDEGKSYQLVAICVLTARCHKLLLTGLL